MNLKIENLLMLVLVMISATHQLHAQAKSMHPEIGQPVPAFTLTYMGNYKNSEMKSTDFKGRHVIIDFWNKNCVSCVQSFPKLNQVHQMYKDKLDLILVGTDEKGIQEMFNKLKEKHKLEFAYAYNMPMYKDFVPGGAPHLVWIDDKGIVRVIGSGADLTMNNIDAFLHNKPFEFVDRSHSFIARQETSYNSREPFLVKGNGGEEYETTFRYRSLITEYIPGSPKKSWLDINLWNQRISAGIPDQHGRSIFETCTDLDEFYRTAFTGHVQWTYSSPIYKEFQAGIILDLKDSSLFTYDYKNGLGLYWYSLIMPTERVTPEYVMESMQTDLKRYFGYNARVETRKFPYLKVVATEKAARLKTKGATTNAEADYSSFRATNISLEDFFGYAFNFQNYWETKGAVPVIINETGIDYKVDINVQINNTSWKDIQQVLTELGFKLVPAEKDFKVVVISDAPAEAKAGKPKSTP